MEMVQKVGVLGLEGLEGLVKRGKGVDLELYPEL
jgi:hypothetical protein